MINKLEQLSYSQTVLKGVFFKINLFICLMYMGNFSALHVDL